MTALMKSRKGFYIFVALLILLGGALSWHRHVEFSVPWFPGEKRQIWSVEAKIDFDSYGEAVKVNFAIPDTQPGFELLREHTASPGYGLSYNNSDTKRNVEWSIRQASGKQTLYYQVDMLVKPETFDQRYDKAPQIPVHRLQASNPQTTAAHELLENARKRSADNYTLTRELIMEFNRQEQITKLLTQTKPRSAWLVDLLHQAGVPAREVLLLQLEDGRRRQPLKSYIQVFEKDAYRIFNPANGMEQQRQNQLLWEYYSGALLDIVGGKNSSVSFSIIDQEVPIDRVLTERQLESYTLLDFSVHSLPLSEQALFKSILLMPVGVLIVALLRILVGVRTSGTFMPVLIAMAFIQTSLLTGLISFTLIVGMGLMIRSYLSHLNLLLISRISAVIISVIIIIAVSAALSFQLGFTEVLNITVFPVIILSWTIERMSILWEEEGAREVLVQGAGSLLVAVLAFLVMTNDWVRHLTFNFLGLQLILMALVLLLGNYTGYRLFEIYRFKSLLKIKSD